MSRARSAAARAIARPRAIHASPPEIARIEAAPAGPSIGAIFDFDRTLIPGYSVMPFLTDRVRRRELGAGEILRLVQMLFESLTGGIDDAELVARGLAKWKGRKVDEMTQLGARLFAAEIEDTLYPQMRAIVEAHRRKGHTLVIATSSTRFQVAPAARKLDVPHVVCTELVEQDGVLTGELRRPVLWGRHKAAAVRELAMRLGVRPERSFFYSDGDEDEALMHLVGHPCPVNPQPHLARVAGSRGWPILALGNGEAPPFDSLLRRVAATASIVPAALGALAIRALTGDRREAANLLTSTLPDISLALGKVKLNVAGEEHLWTHRPAVFIWNHRNIFDAQIVGKLVRRDFGAVAKKELRNVPLFALAAQFMPIAFIDRENSQAAVEALQPVTELLAEGISMVVAPEGTRVSGGELGEFKKGAFRMAMAAGVPIVPIVIRNAEDVGARSSSVMRPATVDVAVLPPISVARWTRANLDRRIAEVRKLYVDQLARWPEAHSS
jgi:putative phosphoserine phosphatase/1-acylglycerol-3-phosphate O-acyltransferase